MASNRSLASRALDDRKAPMPMRMGKGKSLPRRRGPRQAVSVSSSPLSSADLLFKSFWVCFALLIQLDAVACRKRRIKCDETKPRCKNCIKSKRPCEGYTQRVVFKDPANLGQHHDHFGQPVYLPGSRHHAPGFDHAADHAAAQASLQPIAPRPTSYGTSQRQPLSLAIQHAQMLHQQIGQPSYTSSAAYVPIPNPLLGPEASASQDFNAGIASHALLRSSFGSEQLLPESQLEPVGEPGLQLRQSSQTHRLQQYDAATAGQDDDLSLDESDDEPPDLQDFVDGGSRNILKPYARGGPEARTFSAFAQNYALSEYMDYAYSSELRRQDMQTIFMHFVSVTGPTMSLYERNPAAVAPGVRFHADAPLDNNLWSCELILILAQLLPFWRCSVPDVLQILSPCSPSIIQAFSMPSWRLRAFRLPHYKAHQRPQRCDTIIVLYAAMRGM